jgi:hypothetical protein
MSLEKVKDVHVLRRVYLSRLTAAFDYRFGALDDSKNELLNVFDNLLYGSFGLYFGIVVGISYDCITSSSADSLLYPPAGDILFKSMWRYVPERILEYVKFIPTREYRRYRHFLNLTKRTAKSLIDQKSSSVRGEKGSRDVMSILGKESGLLLK